MGQLQETTISPSPRPAAVAGSSPHCLLLPFPAQGHINPFMQLGKRLASHGVRVTVGIIEHVHAKIQRQQQQQQPNFQTLPIHDGLPPDFDRENWSDEMTKVLRTTLEDGALDLLHALASQGHPVTCVIGDFFLRWAWSVAEKAAVPEYIFWPQNASILSIYLHEHDIVASGYDPFEGNAVRASASRTATPMELITCIPGLTTAIHPGDLPFECPYSNKQALQWVRDVVRERFNRMGKARGVIGNSFEALEPEVVKALKGEFQQAKPHPQYNHCWPRSSLPLRLVGPLVPRAVIAASDGKGDDDLRSGGSLWEEEVEECKEWLDAQPAASVLFVAFGSIMNISVRQVHEVAMGLEASGQRCLWVLRQKAITRTTIPAPEEKRGFDIAPEEALPEGFVEQINQQRCKVVRWAPQALVLSHPAVGGFFSHCGWNSTLESLCCGVPLLGWPWLMDQVTNCWLASHVWKVGLTLERNEDNETSRQNVESGVRQLMQEGPLATSLRANARHLRALARKAAQQEEDGLCSLVEDIHSLSRSA